MRLGPWPRPPDWDGGPAAPPRLVLLDEVHTYAGVHGAQVALLLRRWRHSVRRPVTFVGLSATLRDAASFFAQLTGLDETAVDYIEPRPEHLEAEGREYAIALRGDPVSGASLLSTSIQTAMLYGRILDPPGQEYLHGSVGFLFTDDLDVTNRFYDDLRDAEGGQGGPGGAAGAGGSSRACAHPMRRSRPNATATASPGTSSSGSAGPSTPRPARANCGSGGRPPRTPGSTGTPT